MRRATPLTPAADQERSSEPPRRSGTLRGMRSGGRWFRCFAEVPGVGYTGDAQRRARLPDRNVVPSVHEFAFDGEPTISLSWPTPEGSTSASPAHRLAFDDFRDEPTPLLRERVLNALELPGEVMDYHFALQTVAEALFRRRRREPLNLPLVEWLAHLDARLVETHEPLFRVSPQSEDYLSVFALDFLVRLHEREGFLHEALALAERFARFRPRFDTVSALRARVASLRAEHE